MVDPAPFSFYDGVVAPGRRAAFDIPVSRVASGQTVTMPVRIVHGATPGPVLFVSAGIHGDEITGVEIVRRLLKQVTPAKLSGTLVAAPIVNVYGFVANSRYLPDRRDLNRCFPGSENGSLAARLAWLFRTEVIARADFGIDLHSAAIHRTNLPQIRISPHAPQAAELAEAFSPPIIITSPLRDGSLRGVAKREGVEMLLYEAGEGLRFDRFSIRVGLNGIKRVMAAMEMIRLKARKQAIAAPVHATKSLWVRAPRGGTCLLTVEPGAIVTAGQRVGTVHDPVGRGEENIVSPIDGVVIGQARLGVVNRGDALVHIAEIGDHVTRLDEETEERLGGAMLDEDEIV